MFRALAVIAAFALLVYALADFATSDERDRGGIPGWLWVVIIVLLPYFGPLAWISFSRSRRRNGGGPSFPSTSGAPKPRRRPSGPLAPDDDPEFLWRLAREQQRQPRPGAAGTSDTSPGSSAPRTDGQASPGHGASEQGQSGQGQSGQGSHDSTSRDQAPRSGPQDEQSPEATPDN